MLCGAKLEVYLDIRLGESELGSNQSYRSVLVRKDLHGKLKALAAFNEVKIQELASAILEKALQDQDSIKMIIKHLRI